MDCGTKKCTCCGQVKPLEEFYKRASRCKECANAASKEWYKNNRARRRARSKEWYWNNRSRKEAAEKKRIYGITPEQYDQMLQAQGGKCSICGEFMVKPHVDHCHSTGAVRGLLCPQCNQGLGLFYDRLDLLRNAITYLEVTMAPQVHT